jgi:hypothetical protein
LATWRALLLVVALLITAPGTRALATSDVAPLPPKIDAAFASTPPAALPLTERAHHDPAQAASIMLLTGLIALATLGISAAIFIYRFLTGGVHVPTEEEYEAAQHAIHSAEH